MTLSVAYESWNFSVANGTTVTALSVDAAVGDMLVVLVSADNAGSGGASTISSVTDNEGNSYSLIFALNRDPGAANEGVSLNAYSTIVTNTLSSDSVTANFSGTTRYKTVVVYKITPGASGVPTLRSVAAGATGSSSAPTVTSGTAEIDDIVFGVLGVEAIILTTNITGDADTTNGSWSSISSATYGAFTGSDYQAVAPIQTKQVTSSSTQTFNPTLNTARDYCINVMVFYEASSGAAYDIQAGNDSFIITGNTADVLFDRILTATGGSFAISGGAAVLSSTPTVNANPGSYLISGTDANFITSGKVVAATGSFTITGQTAAFQVGGKMIAEAGAYTINGQSATLERTYNFPVDAGSYLISGSSVNFSSASAASTDVTALYTRNFSKMPFWRAVRAKELLWPKWKF
jgi:hypothetical protein